MALVVKEELVGLDRVLTELGRFKDGVQRRIIRRALEKNLRPLRDQMKATAPHEVDLLAKSMGVKTVTYKSSGIVVGIVGPRSRPSFLRVQARPSPPRWSAGPLRIDPVKYGHLQEQGVKPHAIPIRVGPLAGVTVQHPGHLGQPFLEPAWVVLRSATVRSLEDDLWRGIMAEWNKP